MKRSTVKERALLVRILGDRVIDQIFDEKFSKRAVRIRSKMAQLVLSLGADQKVVENMAHYEDAQAARILTLCKTLHSIDVLNIKKSKICRQLRKHLKSKEPCLCKPAQSTKENVPDTQVNKSIIEKVEP